MVYHCPSGHTSYNNSKCLFIFYVSIRGESKLPSVFYYLFLFILSEIFFFMMLTSRTEFQKRVKNTWKFKDSNANDLASVKLPVIEENTDPEVETFFMYFICLTSQFKRTLTWQCTWPIDPILHAELLIFWRLTSMFYL